MTDPIVDLTGRMDLPDYIADDSKLYLVGGFAVLKINMDVQSHPLSLDSWEEKTLLTLPDELIPINWFTWMVSTRNGSQSVMVEARSTGVLSITNPHETMSAVYLRHTFVYPVQRKD